MSKQEWEQIQEDVVNYILKFFGYIEWNYGENRAPFEYPPEFSRKEKQVYLQHTPEL
ncbi:MAG: hypothetical protein ACLFR1_09785 [Spirochaetia bacterium]